MNKIARSWNGELFIETPVKLWNERLAIWKADKTQPCPMPKGHVMFRKNNGMGYELV